MPEKGCPSFSVVCEWSIYLLRCSDDSLYAGIATDVARRLSEHEDGKLGAKYLRGRGPLTLVFQQAVGDRSRASRVEHHIKRLSKQEKEAFIRSPEVFRTHVQALADT